MGCLFGPFKLTDYSDWPLSAVCIRGNLFKQGEITTQTCTNARRRKKEQMVESANHATRGNVCTRAICAINEAPQLGAPEWLRGGHFDPPNWGILSAGPLPRVVNTVGKRSQFRIVAAVWRTQTTKQTRYRRDRKRTQHQTTKRRNETAATSHSGKKRIGRGTDGKKPAPGTRRGCDQF